MTVKSHRVFFVAENNIMFTIGCAVMVVAINIIARNFLISFSPAMKNVSLNVMINGFVDFLENNIR